MLRIKRRNQKRHFIVKQRKAADEDRSPCGGCVNERRSKNCQWCLTCEATKQYADEIADRSPHIAAVDYMGTYSLNAVRQFLREVL